MSLKISCCFEYRKQLSYWSSIFLRKNTNNQQHNHVYTLFGVMRNFQVYLFLKKASNIDGFFGVKRDINLAESWDITMYLTSYQIK